MDMRPFTQASRNLAICELIVLFLIKSEVRKMFLENLRMVSTHPLIARGGIMAFMREPSGSLASTMGELSSRRRPRGEMIRSIMVCKCRLSRKTTFTFSILPRLST